MQVKGTEFAKQFAEIGQASNRAAFEVRFNQVQRGLLQQLEREAAKVQENSGIERDIARLEKERDNLVTRTNNLQDLQFDITSNANRFLDIRDAATNAINAADADGNATLSADEVSALNTAIAEIKEEVFKLTLTATIPEFTDGNLANRLRQELATLESLTAVEGVIDAEGTDPATNDNRAILTTLQSISTRANNYSESSTILVGGLNQVIIDSNKQAFDIEADLANLTAVELRRQEEEILELENRYTNLIRSISLAFEVQSGLGDMLAAGTEFDAPTGSILNIFS